MYLEKGNMEFQKFLEMGRELHLEDKELIEFARARQAEAKEERQQLRAEKQEEREHEKDMKSLELSIAQEQSKLGSSSDTFLEASMKIQAKSRIPKMQAFNEKVDDMDSYLGRFERYATSMKWPHDEWALPLSILLTGKATEVYTRLPDDLASNYEELKLALLHRFELTEDGFRTKFRQCRPETNENYTQFAERIKRYLLRWIELSSTDRTFDGLVDLTMREQIINGCSRELRLFLKERKPGSLSEMTKIADRYQEAHKPTTSRFEDRQVRKDGQRKPFDRGAKGNESERSVSEHRSRDDRTCFKCGKKGHIAMYCRVKAKSQPQASKTAGLKEVNSETPQRKAEVMNSANGSQQQTLAACVELNSIRYEYVRPPGTYVRLETGDELPVVNAVSRPAYDENMPVKQGRIGNRIVTVLRDSGCSTVVVKRTLVNEEQYTGRVQRCVLLDGTVRDVKVARVCIDTPYFVGEVEAVVMENPLYGIIVGNVEGVRSPDDPNDDWSPDIDETVNASVPQINAVETRASKAKQAKPITPLKVNEIPEISKSREDLIKAQQEDKSLSRLFELATKGERSVNGRGAETGYCVRNNLLYREYQSPQVQYGKVIKQLVVPKSYREKVMKLAHDSPLAGHLKVKKTTDRIMANFFWPALQADVRRYCQSCDICQRTVSKGRVTKVPLGEMPLIDTPFKRVAVDIVGPIQPITERGNRYILTLVDYATRYPEAIALRSIETERVAEALLEIFCRVGIPDEILTDRGSQFTSGVMKEVGRLLSIKQLVTSPYHPICNGLVERFNGTLKTMLKRMCSEKPNDWDRYLPAVLFAYREAPQESLGFSPFELLYGRTVKGPLTILKELWSGEVEDEEVKTTYEYVVDLKERLEATCRVAQEELSRSAKRYKKYYDTKSKDRKFRVGDKVLILRPTSNSKLLMQWQGPFEVTACVRKNDYLVQVKGKEKIYHANLLKKYVDRQEANSVNTGDKQDDCDAKHVGANIVIEDDDQEDCIQMNMPHLKQLETCEDVQVDDKLMLKQKQDVEKLVHQFSDIMTDMPGRTHLIEHSVNLTTRSPIVSKAFPVPPAVRKTISGEVEKMLELGVIEKSESAYASPVVLVRKPDGSDRFCIDFRQLNDVTVFNPEPIPNTEDLISRVANAKYFSKLDLTKGYWQIPMAPQDKDKTAFVTSDGHYQFNVMPFGMVNAPAVFSKLMREVLVGVPNVINYIDDILVYTETWEDHMVTLEEVLQRLRNAGLTARPTKCCIGFKSLKFLGHTIGEGIVKPHQDKVDQVLKAERPRTKKQVRSFLGLVGFYRKFIPNFSAIAAPLSDLTKKGNPNKVNWSDAQDVAFETLKRRVASAPILHLPNFDKQFILQTDASDIGIGAVLMQEEDGVKFPISYVSRKLLPREAKYSVIERECLALVWAIKKFHFFLYGKEFILETDHRPLSYLARTKMTNSRIMRWALSLQPYRYRIIAIKGKDNVGADFLSRCPEIGD
ncbi:uncharacterized protein LOC119728962 [Patiria miniata]|uniref:Reverse transcriptase n=1 Tax=Patiria miniata TaxID=46514 RepID=A0A914A0F0_PATMI|nr:uncharacterized protein LOC119728962 [Patiria miniata]